MIFFVEKQLNMSLSSKAYFSTYHGHTLPHLQAVHAALKAINPTHSFVFLAGDSSLDSKYWFHDTAPAANGYEKILAPPLCKADIAHHLNKLFADGRYPYTCINAAREESTISDREHALHPQDCFIRDAVTSRDTLVISVGGNDIALRPKFCTVWNMFLFVKCNTQWCLEHTPEKAWGFSYMRNLFQHGMEDVVRKLTTKTTPKRVVVCHLYYLDEKCGGWADRTLRALGYASNPAKLQAAIRAIYDHGTTKVTIPGTEVVTFPMFRTLDGKTTGDYCMAVEPSAQGNAKLARDLLPILLA